METVPELVKQLTDVISRVMREELYHKDKQWLIEEVIRLTLKDATLADIVMMDNDLKLLAVENDYHKYTQPERDSRLERIRAMGLDETQLHLIIERFSAYDRAQLEYDGFLAAPPPKGGRLIDFQERDERGNQLLCEAKDVLFALLFGSAEMNTRLKLVERELLTITIPRTKRFALGFLLATTEIGATGNWRDPRGKAHDENASNVLIQIEYGETATEIIGTGIAACLRIINDLEVNEVILYQRMSNIEQSSLIST